MCHIAWLQDQTPTCALDGQTPYEMKNGKKPYLGGIQEFEVAAYLKDLKARKLDPQAKMGRFVGYNSESKGYWIYWPGKHSVTVERNVVFDGSNTKATPTHLIVMSWLRERMTRSSNHPQTVSKMTRLSNHPQTVPKTLKIPKIRTTKSNNNQLKQILITPILYRFQPPKVHKILSLHLKLQTTMMNLKNMDIKKAPGAYKTINDGLTAALVQTEDLEVEDPSAEIMEEDVFDLLPLDFALIGGLCRCRTCFN